MAISFDAASNGAIGNTNSITWSHTCTGVNGMLFVIAQAVSGDEVSGVTYNSVAMTQIQKVAVNGGFLYLYALAGPATGANTVSVNSATTNYKIGGSSSYTGVNQSVTLDASGTRTATEANYSQSLTSIADNCWQVWAYSTNGSAPVFVQTQRADLSSTGSFIVDTNTAKTPPGSVTMSTVFTSQSCGSLMASFAPVIPGPTGVKTIDGLAVASVKTVNGLAIASVKTVNG